MMMMVMMMIKGIYTLRHRGDVSEKAESSATMIMKTLDHDGDGKLSAREFITAAAKDPVVVNIIDGKAT